MRIADAHTRNAHTWSGRGRLRGEEGKRKGPEVDIVEELEQAIKPEEGRGRREVEGERKKKRRELNVDGLDDDVPRKQSVEVIRGKYHQGDRKWDNERVEELAL